MKKLSKLHKCAIAVIVLGGCCSSIFAQPADNYANWNHYTNVILNTQATGANIATAQAGFPVLVRLTSTTPTFSFGQAQSGGQDIRFAKSDGTHIPYQIERWNSVNQIAEIWVKFDVNGNDNTQYFVMYWGNAAASDSSNGANVFSSSNGFLGVWHLKEQGNSNVGGYADATGTHVATGNNMVAGDQVAAAIDSGQNFGNGTLGKTISLFQSGSGSGCTVGITALQTNGAINTINPTPVTGGTGYAVGDQLLVAGGSGGYVHVTAIGAGGAATTIALTECAPQGGTGAGDTLNITATGGVITGVTVRHDYGYYHVNDVLTVGQAGSGNNAQVTVTATYTNAGTINALAITNGGTGYTTGIATTTNASAYTVGTAATKDIGPGAALAAASNFSFSTWVLSTGSTNSDCIFNMATATNGHYILLDRQDANNLNVSTSGPNGHNCYTIDNSYPASPGTWSHVGFTVTAAGVIAIYVNGFPSTVTTTANAIGSGSYYLNRLGATYYNGDAQFFQGQLNEAEASNVARSADWMNLCYQSQKPGSNWISYYAPVTSAPGITSILPASQTVNSGQGVTISVVATGGGLGYQWQQSNDGVSNWTNISAATAGTYNFTAGAAGTTYYRDSVYNTMGSVTSSAVSVTVICPSPITTQPSPWSDTAGQNATFSVGTSGSGLTYQWQRLNAGGTTWGNVTTGIGGNTATYCLTTATADNGAQFRCQVTAALRYLHKCGIAYRLHAAGNLAAAASFLGWYSRFNGVILDCHCRGRHISCLSMAAQQRHRKDLGSGADR